MELNQLNINFVDIFTFVCSGSQNNLNLCNGSMMGNNNEKHGLVKKVQNQQNSQRKPTVSKFSLYIFPIFLSIITNDAKNY